MAKGKHAAALFEVISKSKPAEPRSAQKPERVRAPRAESTSPGMAVDVDSDHHVISMKLSFATAGTAASVVVVLMILAFLVGRRVGANGLPAVVDSTEQLRQHPPHPTVLNVGRQTNPQPSPLLLTATSTDSTSTMPPAPAPIVVANPQRQVGLNYVIMQSYPDEKSATDARDMLIANNIPCTIEKGPAGWGPMNWFSVIGTTGFERARGTQYDTYIQTIQAVGAKFAGTSKFKRFEPHAYKWKDVH